MELEPLHGAEPPKREIGEEQLWHRSAAYMVATGMGAREVAAALEKSPPTIYNLFRQPWFQQRVISLMEKHGGQDVMALLRGEQIASAMKLVELRDNPESPAKIQFDSAKEILNRTLGMPKQFVEQSGKIVSTDPVAEARALEEEVKKLETALHV